LVIKDADKDDHFEKFTRSISGMDKKAKYPEISIRGNIILTKNRLYD
jgi:hypothetical protein